MFENMSEKEAREQILEMVEAYTDRFHAEKPYRDGDRIAYASRVFDREEMRNLVDSSLDFWLTAGRYTNEFEQKLGEYLGVRYVSFVNSGSSANLNAFMALTSPLLKERQIRKGDEVITEFQIVGGEDENAGQQQQNNPFMPGPRNRNQNNNQKK